MGLKNLLCFTGMVAECFGGGGLVRTSCGLGGPQLCIKLAEEVRK